MKPLFSLLVLLASAGLHAQTWDLGTGASANYLERYGPYNGPQSPILSVLTAGYARPLPISGSWLHQARVGLTLAPRGHDHDFSYGYLSVGLFYEVRHPSARFSWMAGLSLRRESYNRSGYRSQLANGSVIDLSEGVDGKMVRPFIGGGISYSGLLLPFRQEGRVKLFTRFMVEKALFTPSSQGWEDELRRNLNQEPTPTLQAGVRF